MHRLFFQSWPALCLALALTACSSTTSGPTDDTGSGPPDDATPINHDGDVDEPRMDGGENMGDDGATSSETGTGEDGAACKTACDPDDCGEFVSDLCGGHLNCGVRCPEGQGCGLVRPDKCDFPPPVTCTPKDPATACEGKCGKVENGCSNGFIDCPALGLGVTCDANYVCGGTDATERKPNECVYAPPPTCTPLTCASLFENLRAGGRTAPMECGTISDGCGGTVDCALESGGCEDGEICHFGDYRQDVLANSCVPVATCTPTTPAATLCAGKCGTLIDECGQPVDCTALSGACPSSQTCGGGGTQNVCGSNGTACQPIAAATACAGRCGFVSDGCSGGYTCTANNGGVTCDGNRGESCGGGGVPGSCGKTTCVPSVTQTEVCRAVNGNKSCANGVSDGCGNVINCGGCPIDQVCGLDTPDVCGTPVLTCTPIPEAVACAGKCGVVSDGCGTGGFYTCNGTNGGVTCAAPEFCGSSGGQTNRCVAPVVTCTPKTCAQLGHTCGKASDGCGHELNCWPGCSPSDPNCDGSCGTGSACISNQTTGAQSCVAGGPSCTGTLCSSVPTSCSAASPTRLTGTVRTPGRVVNGTAINQLPVPNAIIYIPASPSAALPAIFEGVAASDSASCGRCSDEKLVADGQSVLAAAITNFKGEFTLEGRIPVGVPFKVVVKIGKWRRVIEVPANVAAACNTRALALQYTRLPATSVDGLSGTHLPKIAVSTGRVDAMECVFRGMGIADSEFSLPSANGRVHMYRANGARMEAAVATCQGTYQTNSGQTRNCTTNNNFGCRDGRTGCSWSVPEQDDRQLFTGRLNQYDLVVADCEGFEHKRTDSADGTTLGNVESFVNAGGRLFASHFSYTLIEDNGSLDASADWGAGGSASSGTGFISLPSGNTQRARANAVKSALFRDWLDWQGALAGTTAGMLTQPATPQFTITDPRDRAGSNVGPQTDEWVYRLNGSTPRVQQLSFNTPYGASTSNICGRVAYSGFHVANASNSDFAIFPNHCIDAELTAQEKILAFMLFDLATCVSAGDPPTPPSCTPKTVANTCPGVNDACGYLPDGCGGTIDCGGCASGFYCDGVSCKVQQCTPATCSSLGFNCGFHADGCGGIARNSQGVEGCGDCTGGQVCGLGGPGLCGGTNCTPIPSATACAGKNCGSVSNGCGGTYTCGQCTDPQVCGGGGTPNVCGDGSCTQIARATACAGKNCGSVSDGCGGSYNCGTCTAPDTCGGGGSANVCGHPSCTPKTQQEACAGKQCGWTGDGCGGAIQCGTCPNGGVCGGAGPNQCGSTCARTSCSARGAQCGAISDECGGVLNCGVCPTGQVCGAAGPNQCGSGSSCTPRTCAQVGAQCGLIGDGCNGVLDCGECTAPGQTCGGAGVPNQCGTGTGGCNKLTCDAQSVECGATTDGCGGLLDCGGCPGGFTCSASKCVALPPVLL